MFNAVQNELKARQESINKYAGVNIITRKLVCGKCGGSMRRVTFHSNDKYRCHRYRCVNRYAGTRDCDMRIIREEYIKDEFVKAVNEVIKNKKSIIEEAKVILKTLDNTKELKEKLMRDISIKVDELLKSNSNKIKDQEKFKKEYDELEAEHMTLKAKA